jgi:uncharacterized membrane protein
MNTQNITHWLSRFTLSRRVAVSLTIAALVSCAATYVFLTEQTENIDTVYWLLNLDLILFLLMGTVISHQVVKLWSDRKKGLAHGVCVWGLGSDTGYPYGDFFIHLSLFWHSCVV